MKFKTNDKLYLKKRKSFSNKNFPMDIWQIADNWPLYAGVSNIARSLTISDLIRETLEIPGHIAEFGSWNGANLILIAKILRIYNPMCNKIIHSFDSFEGLTQFNKKDGAAEKQKGKYTGNIEILSEILDLYELDDDVEIHRGLIQKTLPELLEKSPEIMFSFVYVDTDLYEPTKLILEKLSDRVVSGGLIIFDQWNDQRWPGEGLAANEYLKKSGAKNFKLRSVQHSRQPTMVLQKKQS